ncbi:uroporphyrinogen-III synthase [Paracoccus alkenifer]|uniref:Uroporphyrinogen-III synthase n=1 Tax=Paracoccus alkenifer TaxID=65735 RepID=A0A1H6L7G3_9RHOB|nr:uroporphyrinogen-III synthase [Paracoccus alkenifer]SEH84197.1 uroporphyrinogen-III synthase [Paracoccus alkenifer]
MQEPAPPDSAPPHSAPVVLLIRPQEAAERFAAQIAPMGLRALISPMLRIVPVPHDAAALQAARGLVFTSENGVRFAGPGRGRPAWCVGPRTAKAAAAAGYDAITGPGDAARLIPLISDLGPGWLHAHGRHLAARLPVPGVVVYDQQALPLSAQARALLAGDGPVILPLFSPRSARLAAQAVAPISAKGPLPPLRLIAISEAARIAWDAHWPGPTLPAVVTDTPDAEGVLRALAPPSVERSDIAAG